MPTDVFAFAAWRHVSELLEKTAVAYERHWAIALPFGQAAEGTSPSWIDIALGQLTLLGRSGKFNRVLLDYFNDDPAVCLVVEISPTTYISSYRSAWLGDRDVLGDISA